MENRIINFLRSIGLLKKKHDAPKATGAIEGTVVDQMIKIRPLVAQILKSIPETRDDDNLLLVEFWRGETKKPMLSYNDFSSLLVAKDITTPETITRTRRKLQEQYPELRGELYETRQRLERVVSCQMKMDLE